MKKTKSYPCLPADKPDEPSFNVSPTSVTDAHNDFDLGLGFDLESDNANANHIFEVRQQYQPATLITMMLAEKKLYDASHRSRFFSSNINNVNDNTQKPDRQMQHV